MLCRFDGERIAVEQLARFANTPRTIAGGLHWDAQALIGNVTASVRRALEQAGDGLTSIGVDAWGVDYGLIDHAGELLEDPLHYRDARTAGAVERAASIVSPDTVYDVTGIQVLPMNTLYQFYAARESAVLRQASTLLFIPDLMTFQLTGERVAERTIASTSQMLDIRDGGWATGLLERLGLPVGILPPLVEPGTVVGLLRPEIANTARVPVVAVAGHDTASAVLGIPSSTPHVAFISSGTWSLVGIELRQPIVSVAARRANFTNEAGFGGTIRYLKNVTGLWLLQESRRTWEAQGASYTYDALTALAAMAPRTASFIDPDHPAFLPPGDMPARIQALCRATGQPALEGIGEIARCILTSLALTYRRVIDLAIETSGTSVETIHIVGGGARNELLCQMTADATGRPVIAGPVEATALGNALAQAFAAGMLRSRDDIRAVARRSVDVQTFMPGTEQGWWDAAWAQYQEMLARSEAVRAEMMPG
jgi:rhamnulokinase